MPATGLIIPTLLMVFALAWSCSSRAKDTFWGSALLRIANLPAAIWIPLGIFAFCIPVLEYWFTAKSHGNALAGFLPWADANEYFQCSELYLLAIDGPPSCAKRPYYFAFFADLLWLMRNNLQAALLLQSLTIGSAAVFFSRLISRQFGVAASLAVYAVFYVYAATLCSGLIMTENVGLLLGTLGVLVLWLHGWNRGVVQFLIGLAVVAAAVSARPGPFFILPALLGW